MQSYGINICTFLSNISFSIIPPRLFTLLRIARSSFHDWVVFYYWATELNWNIPLCICISSVQSLSHVQLFATPWTAACQTSLSITNSKSLLKLLFIELVMPSNHLILYHPLLLLPSIFPSIRVFSNESVLCIRWPKYWSFCFSISPSNEYSGLISVRIDWLDLLAVQGTLKSLLQHHSSKPSVLWHLAFFIAQSHEQYVYIYTTSPLSIHLLNF